MMVNTQSVFHKKIKDSKKLHQKDMKTKKLNLVFLEGKMEMLTKDLKRLKLQELKFNYLNMVFKEMCTLKLKMR